MQGISFGELMGFWGFVKNILKAIFLFCVVSSILISETHLFGFAITNLFVDHYDFKLLDFIF